MGRRKKNVANDDARMLLLLTPIVVAGSYQAAETGGFAYGP